MKDLMKDLLLTALLLSLSAFLVSDAIRYEPKDRFVQLAATTQVKSVAIYVKTVVPVIKFNVEGSDLTVTKTTATVKITGSGVFITPNGHVLTCAHLFTEGRIKDIQVVQSDGTAEKGEVLFKDVKADLALLKIKAYYKLPYAILEDPRKLAVGQEVLAVGNPLGLPFTVTHGIISALNRDDFKYNLTQSDAFINPGNSGGPLFNLHGKLVGINTLILPPIDQPVFTGLGFSVPPGQILEFLTRFKGLDKAVQRR